MNFFGRVVKLFTGRINKNTQRVNGWHGAVIDYTSNFVMNIHYKIANEIAKVNFNHVQYTTKTNGLDTIRELDGSDIDEVLNWKPKGYENTTEFWINIILLMFSNKYIHLDPILDDQGRLIDLLVIGSEEYNLNETVNLVSPFFVNDDTSILDNALSGIADKLDKNKLRSYLKINSIIDTEGETFKEEAKSTIKTLQEVGSINGMGILDAKSEIVELKNSYSSLNQEEMQMIKDEILSAYFMPESILTGKASQQEQITFYNNTIIPILTQLEKELTYKLLSSYKRVRNDKKQTYERIIIDNNIMKFASIKDIVSFTHENGLAPNKTRNEMRLMLGDRPIEGGDVFVTNLNSKTTTEDGSEVNPTEKTEEEET